MTDTISLPFDGEDSFLEEDEMSSEAMTTREINFFKESSSHVVSNRSPCQITARFMAYNSPLYAGTVTIGKTSIMRKSTYTQYEYLRNKVRSYRSQLRRRGGDCIATYENTKNQVCHAHLLIYEGTAYQSLFHAVFGICGRMNMDDRSYQKVSNLKLYVEYILKEVENNEIFYNYVPTI